MIVVEMTGRSFECLEKGRAKALFSAGRVQRREHALSGFLFGMARRLGIDHIIIKRAMGDERVM